MKMKKEALLELSLKLGIKEENFEHGHKADAKALEKQVLAAAKHMGLIKK